MDAELLGGIVGVVLSLIFSYVPGVARVWEGLSGESKRLVMFMMLLATAGCVYGLACAGIAPALGLQVSCDMTGAIDLISILIAALVANQGIYKITKG